MFSKRIVKIFSALFLAIIVSIPITATSEAIQNFNVKIGVADGVAGGKVLGEGLIFTDAKGRKGSVRNGAVIKASGGGISVGNVVLAMPVTATAKSGLGWDSVKYRGRLVFIRAASGFTVVNELDIENYVRGILKMEMSADWPQEALKAQAILARTYAVKNRGKFAKRGYDFDAGENSQVYRGVNAESPSTDKAVSQTAGMILAWNGEAADVFYHSDSGGATADISHVWGSSRPYLRVRQEAVNYTSPNSTWQAKLSQAQVTSILSNMKQNVGNVQSVAIALADEAGRAVQLKVTGDRGAVNVKAHDFRMAAGPRVIKSTKFQIARPGGAIVQPIQNAAPAPTVPAPAANTPPVPAAKSSKDDFIEMTRAGIFTSVELIDMLTHPEKREEYKAIGYERMKERGGVPSAETPNPEPAPQKPTPPPVSQTGSGDFIFTGKGWGHGVGLSQWGAKAMADKGIKCEEILGHYFPGTKIGK
jgi:stage II sporulation protein D